MSGHMFDKMREGDDAVAIMIPSKDSQGRDIGDIGILIGKVIQMQEDRIKVLIDSDGPRNFNFSRKTGVSAHDHDIRLLPPGMRWMPDMIEMQAAFGPDSDPVEILIRNDTGRPIDRQKLVATLKEMSIAKPVS